MSKKKPLALVDLDGTLADFHSALLRDMKKLLGPHELEVLAGEPLDLDSAYDIPHLRERMRLIKSQPGWWLGLEELPKGFEIVNALRAFGFRLHILTRGPKRIPSAWSEKMQWALLHVPDADITVTHDKSKFYGRILVDDWPEYIEPWLRHRANGLVVMPDQPWNRDFSHPQVLRYRGLVDAEALISALKAQKDRT